MKTSILYGRCNSPRRASLPHEDPSGERVPRFCAAYMATVGFLGNAKTRQEQQPDRLGFSGYQFDLQPGGNVKPFKSFNDVITCDAKLIPQEYVDKLDALDTQITELEKQRRELVLEAWPYGTRLNANQFKPQPQPIGAAR